MMRNNKLRNTGSGRLVVIGMALAIGVLVTILSVSLIADDAATHGVCEFSVVGRALLEGADDHSSIGVEAWLGGSSANTVATCQVDGNGDYTLGPIPCLEEADSGYVIVGIYDGYTRDSQWLRKPNGTSPAQVDLPDLVLHIQKQVSFNWVHQPNGTTTFDSGLQQGTTTLLSSVEGDSDHCGFIFATETVTRPTADVYFSDGKRYPYGFWANNGIGGVIDMGPIALESVTDMTKSPPSWAFFSKASWRVLKMSAISPEIKVLIGPGFTSRPCRRNMTSALSIAGDRDSCLSGYRLT